MVLPVTSSRVKKTTAPMLRMSNWILPACFAHDAAKAFSVSVLVSHGEFEKVSSILFWLPLRSRRGLPPSRCTSRSSPSSMGFRFRSSRYL